MWIEVQGITWNLDTFRSIRLGSFEGAGYTEVVAEGLDGWSCLATFTGARSRVRALKAISAITDGLIGTLEPKAVTEFISKLTEENDE